MHPLVQYLVINLIQVAFLVLFAPLLKGVLARLEEIIQGKHGPSIFQPYYDIWKLLGKDEIVSSESTWLFRFAPLIEFAMPIMVVILIPALTTYPLFFAFAGDMIAVGFLFSASGFFVVLAAMDTAQVYGSIGASRTRGIPWNAGLVRVSPEMHYTATTFAAPARVMLNAVLAPDVSRKEERQGAFLIGVTLHEVHVHIIDRLITTPLIRAGQALARLLTRMHHGPVTSYASYIVAAMLIVLLVEVWNL